MALSQNRANMWKEFKLTYSSKKRPLTLRGGGGGTPRGLLQDTLLLRVLPRNSHSPSDSVAMHVSRNAGSGHKWKYIRTEKKASQTNVGDPTKQSKLYFLQHQPLIHSSRTVVHPLEKVCQMVLDHGFARMKRIGLEGRHE